ncbi:PREDICTED: serine palmitoyltransferase 1-like [Priapulus caudatus]|uniref:Serine palmitoyltransferase 1 n=1 Tax=Priapulus caudatus TaxID=37621 RepID=A0ABM1EZV7_PRICU|nr:PREDICTED: serine palmitoyltransferase 1-like [Priapulus caudatus]
MRTGVWYLQEIILQLRSAPAYLLLLEAVLLVWLIKVLFFTKSYKPHRTKLTQKEKEDLVEEWTPEPLVPDTPADHPGLHPRSFEGKLGKIIRINGQDCINLASLNFLDMNGNEEIEAGAIKTLKKYGVGACGPRGFYGTIDIHLELEDKLSAFLGLEEVAQYSYGFSVLSTAIPAYAKSGDVIFCDEGACFAIQQGLRASRSKVWFFKHNDADDLERMMKLQDDIDQKNPQKALTLRRFLVVEGLYMNYGDICPLPKLIELKKRYKVRMFLDESLSFGVLGANGKGVTEYFGVPITDVDWIGASLENCMATTGGFCGGRAFVMNHQRLGGLGYAFSAALPSMLASSTITSLEQMQRSPDMFVTLARNATYMQQKLESIPGMTLKGLPISPIKHLSLEGSMETRKQEVCLLEEVVQEAESRGVAIVLARYLDDMEYILPKPSIRVAVSSGFSVEELSRAADVVATACATVLARHRGVEAN